MSTIVAELPAAAGELAAEIGVLSLDSASLLQLYSWRRLGLRICAMLTWDLEQQVKTMVEFASHVIKRSNRLAKVLQEGPPALLALYAIDRLGAHAPSVKVPEVAREMLITCFSLSYCNLFASKSEDHIKHFLTRMDWFGDGEKGASSQAVSQVLTALLNLKDVSPEYMDRVLLPEMDRRMLIAWRREFPA